jgi:hypothetical protein
MGSPPDYYNPSIACFLSNLWVVFEDEGSIGQLKFSDNGGNSFQDAVQINEPSIGFSDPDVDATSMWWAGCVWGSNGDIYFAKLTSIPGSNVLLDEGAYFVPKIAVCGQYIYVVYADLNYDPARIIFKRSLNGGDSWWTSEYIGDSSAWDPCIACSGDKVYAAWSNITGESNSEIYLRRSADRGGSWQVAEKVTDSVGYSDSPSLEADSEYVFLVWDDNKTGNYEIYYKSSSDSGENWSEEDRLTNHPAESRFPDIDVTAIEPDNYDIHVVWRDRLYGGNDEIYYRHAIFPPGGIKEVKRTTSIPKAFYLYQNYPNPFNPSTTIEFRIPENDEDREVVHVSLQIYTIRGQCVRTLLNETKEPGDYKIYWNGTDDNGMNLSSGIYLCQIVAGNYMYTRKMVLLK